jgi:hypothetical protein
MLAILIAVFIGAWGLPASSQPQATQRVEKQTQPAQQDGSAEPSINEKEQKTDNGASKKESDQSRLDRIVKFVREYNAEIVAISTAVMGFFTVALFIATWALWKSGEKHSERELRAYVFPIDIKVRNFKTSEKISAFVKIKNTGQTPAYKFTCQIKMIAGPFPQTDFTISKEESDLTPASIGPHEAISYTPTTDTPLSWEQQEDVAQGRWAIYVFGRIDYVDAFKVPRWTTFRTFARGDNGRMYRVEGERDVLALVIDKDGNDAT